MMENTKLVLVLCILMSSCVTLCVSSSSFDADLGDYLGGMMGGSSVSCMEKLLPCQPFLVPGPAPPPANCCIPLKQLITNDTKCICDTFNNPLVRGSLNVSMDDIMKLPKACNETFDIAVCNATGPAASVEDAKTQSTPGKAKTASLDSESPPAAADSDSSQDGDAEADAAPDADSKASGANAKFVSSIGREYTTSLAFFVAFVLSVY
ncbi:hypothetical protein DCAR_0415810 [Daucus carota subsp. sativus]|uniref:Bifunctional inhibitor/plant lipid transfer protein/seed storage helical domain-containing protein n=1 Tax=Daucus carota subsp. sativus TaxID=79200 RepID=A0AAF0WYV9_DAUCS|nr:PREDICTED: protein YLS3-like [Daucus carota subsp. sativus]WOG96475.1 hypothetical protein DCAR_0415810 [Daucus carota subsp. sativus]